MDTADFGYADPARRLGIGFSKNYFMYRSGGAVNQGNPPPTAADQVANAVFDALGLEKNMKPDACLVL